MPPVTFVLVKVISFMAIIFTVATSQLRLFPRIMWTYWHDGYESASLFTKLCLENKRRVAEANGWEFRLINSTSIYDWLNRAKFDSIFERLWEKKAQKRANLLRMMLMIQYGGMWIDADTYFMRDLTWADNPSTSSLFKNKLDQLPQVVVGAYSQGPPTISKDPDLNKDVIVYPGLENWFLLSKPDQLFFHDMSDHLMEVINIGKDAMDKKIAEENIEFYPTYMNHYFFMSDYIEQVMMHRRQMKIDSQIPRPKNPVERYAMGQYKLWHFEAMDTCFSHLNNYKNYGKVVMWFDMITYTAEEMLQIPKVGSTRLSTELPFFMKHVGWQYVIYDFFLASHTRINCWAMAHSVDPNSQIGTYLFSEANTQRLTEQVRPIKQQLDSDSGFCFEKIDKAMNGNEYLRYILFGILYLAVPVMFLFSYTLSCWWGAGIFDLSNEDFISSDKKILKKSQEEESQLLAS